MPDNYYGSLVYLCEASIALNYAYLELIKRRKFKEINEKREKLVKQIENELPKIENETDLRDAVKRIKKKLKNLLSPNLNERFDAWQVDMCRSLKTDNQTKKTKCDKYDSTTECLLITPSANSKKTSEDNLPTREKCKAHKKYPLLPLYVSMGEWKVDARFAKYSIFIATILLVGIIPLPDDVLEIPWLWRALYFLLFAACLIPVFLYFLPDKIENGLEERIKTLEKEYQAFNLQEVEQTSSLMQKSAEGIGRNS